MLKKLIIKKKKFNSPQSLYFTTMACEIPIKNVNVTRTFAIDCAISDLDEGTVNLSAYLKTKSFFWTPGLLLHHASCQPAVVDVWLNVNRPI